MSVIEDVVLVVIVVVVVVVLYMTLMNMSLLYVQTLVLGKSYGTQRKARNRNR